MREFEYLLEDGESLITEADLMAVRYRPDFAAFPPENDERSQLIEGVYGSDSRELLVRDQAQRLYVEDNFYQFRYQPGSLRMIINSFIKNPNGLLPMVTVASATGSSARAAVVYFNETFAEPPVIPMQNRDGRTFLQLPPNLKLKRADSLISNANPPEKPTEPLADQGEKQTIPTPEQLEKAMNATPIFDKKVLAAANSPDRFAIILNAELVNWRTEQLLARVNQGRAADKQVRPTQMIFYGDKRVEINDRQHPTGPVPTRILHRLITRYLDGWVEVSALRASDSKSEEVALQSILRGMYAEGSILAEGQRSIDRVMLKPTLFQYR